MRKREREASERNTASKKSELERIIKRKKIGKREHSRESSSKSESDRRVRE